MKSILKAIVCAIIVDFFYFSSVFSFTQGVNSKLILAVLGLVTFFIKSAHNGQIKISRQMIVLTLLASGVSLVSLFSMIENNTIDNTYMSYVISMLVWLSAAYMVVVSIELIYGKVSLNLIASLIIAICVFQCIIALLGNLYPPVNHFIKTISPRVAGYDSVQRMYGIGDTTALDVGGIRYAIACVLCSHMIIKTAQDKKLLIPLYILAYIVITIIGNMIARTTIVGAVLAILYLLGYFIAGNSISYSKIKVMGWLLALLTIMISATVWLYNTNPTIHENLRFGFEGFFSLAESGHWSVSSNNQLLRMYIFPDNPHTWLIGDGYFSNPAGDPNYIGTITKGFYNDTDVGYLRFIYYFGLIGLTIFSIMILFAGYMCIANNPGNTILFILLVLVNFIVWLKVSTDCFFILAVFIALAYVRDYSGSTTETGTAS